MVVCPGFESMIAEIMDGLKIEAFLNLCERGHENVGSRNCC